MSSDPPNRYDRPGGGKIYRHPITGEVFDSVTSALDIFDKDGLKRWAAIVAADAAFELLPQLSNSVLEPDCSNTYNRCYQKHGRENTCERCPCGKCERCIHRRLAHRHDLESSRRSSEGTEVHSAINMWILSGGAAAVTLSPEAQPYFRTFMQWVKDYGLDPRTSWVQTEATLLNREHGYAGTSDAAVIIRRGTVKADAFISELNQHADQEISEALVRVDYKTREKPDERLYNDMPLQGEAYERCNVAMLPDGSELPAPRTVARCVLQLRPDVDADGNPVANPYTFTPMRSGDRVFATFLGLLEAYRWMNDDGGKKAFGLAMLNPASQTPIVKVDTTQMDPWARSLEAKYVGPGTTAGAKALPEQPPVAASVVEVNLPAEPPDEEPAVLWAERTSNADDPWDGTPASPPVSEFPSGEFDDPWGSSPSDNHLTPTAFVPAPPDEPWPPDPPFDPPYEDVTVKAAVTPPPEPAKPAKKAPARKAAAKRADEPNGSATVERSLREQAGRWPVGAPHTHLLDEQIPF